MGRDVTTCGDDVMALSLNKSDSQLNAMMCHEDDDQLVMMQSLPRRSPTNREGVQEEEEGQEGGKTKCGYKNEENKNNKKRTRDKRNRIGKTKEKRRIEVKY